MSLTAFVERKDIKAEIRRCFPKKPPWRVRKSPIVSVTTTKPQVLGSAIDYFVRLHAERVNRQPNTSTWLAVVGAEFASFESPLMKLRTQAWLHDARCRWQDYLERGVLTEPLLSACIRLGQLEHVYRAKRLGPKSFLPIEPADVEDMWGMAELAREQPWLTAEHRVLLNAKFCRWSKLIHGADCDLVVNDMIVELKTTKDTAISRRYLDQLIGYFILSRLDESSRFEREGVVTRLGIYFTRFGKLLSFSVDSLATAAQVDELTEVFRRRLDPGTSGR
jgi:hypothetical protein